MHALCMKGANWWGGSFGHFSPSTRSLQGPDSGHWAWQQTPYLRSQPEPLLFHI